MISIGEVLAAKTYPGRGIVVGKSKDGHYAVTAYFIMGRSENSRNRIFVGDGEGIRTEAFDETKLSDPSLIIYSPVKVIGNKTIITSKAEEVLHWLMQEWKSAAFYSNGILKKKNFILE